MERTRTESGMGRWRQACGRREGWTLLRGRGAAPHGSGAASWCHDPALHMGPITRMCRQWSLTSRNRRSSSLVVTLAAAVRDLSQDPRVQGTPGSPKYPRAPQGPISPSWAHMGSMRILESFEGVFDAFACVLEFHVGVSHSFCHDRVELLDVLDLALIQLLLRY